VTIFSAGDAGEGKKGLHIAALQDKRQALLQV
jgi:hypothetical protein